MITLVGFGRSGYGSYGYTSSASLTDRRYGSNVIDSFNLDAEGSGVFEINHAIWKAAFQIACMKLFPALRGAIDARRGDGQCHFCILGSAQPALIQAVSESWAGRIGCLELDPLMAAETGLPLAAHWLAGGFPEALRGNFRNWWEPYLSTVRQRDLAAYGFRPDAVFLRRLLTMLATQQGGLLNMSALGSALGVSHHTVEHGNPVGIGCHS